MAKIRDTYDLSERDVDRIITMAWEDRTPFEAITYQFELSEAEVIQLMREELKLRSWKNWRARVQGRKTKHRKLRPDGMTRFKADRQRAISHNKIPKR
jgi:uncharacterized protein (TIGR03643 family)